MRKDVPCQVSDTVSMSVPGCLCLHALRLFLPLRQKIGKRYGGAAQEALRHRSLFLFSPRNAFRRLCLRLVIWKHFDTLVTYDEMFGPCPTAESLHLALESPAGL